jgi:hypothetical protein
MLLLTERFCVIGANGMNLKICPFLFFGYSLDISFFRRLIQARHLVQPPTSFYQIKI